MRFPFLKPPLAVRAAVLCLILFAADFSAEAVELGDLFGAADSLSPALGNARLELARAKSEYQASRAMPNPTLFGSRETVSDGVVDEEERTVGIQQSLGYLWSYVPKRAAARSAWESAIAEFEEARRQLHTELADRALAVLNLRQQITLMDTVLFHATGVAQAMESRYNLGDVSEYDLHRLQAELLRLQQQRFNLLADYQEAAMEFTRLSGLPSAWLDQLTLPAADLTRFTSEEQAVETAFRERSMLQSRLASRDAAVRAYTASTWNQLPDFAVSIGRKTADPGFNGIVLEAQVELPLFTQRRNERLLERTRKNQAEIELRAARTQIEQEVRGTYRRMQELRHYAAGTITFDTERAGKDLSRGALMYLHGELSPVEIVDILRSTLESFEAYRKLADARLLADLELRRVTGLPLLENH